MPISRDRIVARTSIRFATFAHAMSSTSATAPSSINIQPLYFANQMMMQGDDLDAPAGTELRILLLEASGDAVHLLVRLRGC